MKQSERKMNPQELRRFKEWEHKFELSEKFIKVFGRMPLVHEMYDGVCLYRWLILEKSKYLNGKMEKKTVERFMKIGIDIAHFSARPKTDKTVPFKVDRSSQTSFQQLFEQELVLLKNYIEINHRFPDANESIDNYPIGKSCEKWRRQYRNKKLSENRIKELNQIDFPWTATELKWRRNYLLLQEFMETYKRFPCAGEVYNDRTIGTWLYHQRQLFRKGKLNSKHLMLLNDLDFMNTPRIKKTENEKAV